MSTRIHDLLVDYTNEVIAKTLENADRLNSTDINDHTTDGWIDDLITEKLIEA